MVKKEEELGCLLPVPWGVGLSSKRGNNETRKEKTGWLGRLDLAAYRESLRLKHFWASPEKGKKVIVDNGW